MADILIWVLAVVILGVWAGRLIKIYRQSLFSIDKISYVFPHCKILLIVSGDEPAFMDFVKHFLAALEEREMTGIYAQCGSIPDQTFVRLRYDFIDSLAVVDGDIDYIVIGRIIKQEVDLPEWSKRNIPAKICLVRFSFFTSNGWLVGGYEDITLANIPLLCRELIQVLEKAIISCSPPLGIPL